MFSQALILAITLISQNMAIASVDVPWYISPDRFEYKIKPKIKYFTQQSCFQYTYKVTNEKKSEQGISLFGFINHDLNEKTFQSPNGWMIFKIIGDDLILGGKVGIEQILPGKSQDGFTFECNKLPMIDYVYARTGMAELMKKNRQPNNVSQSELDVLYKRELFPNGYKKLIGLIPGPNIQNLSVSDIARHLRNQYLRAANFSLLGSTAQSSRINDLISQIETSVQSNDCKTARKALKSLAQTLHGKKDIDVSVRVTMLLTGHYLKNRLRNWSPSDPDSLETDQQEFNSDNEDE